MPTGTHKATVIALHMKSILENEASLALEDVFYGDSDYIPRVPTVAIEVGDKTREIAATGLSADVEFQIILMVYHARLADVHEVQLQADQLVEDIEDFINADKNMGGNVVFGTITSTEQGLAVRNEDEVMRAARMTWTGQSRQRL